MWMTSGDCLIYFSDETSYEDPRPSLRLHAGVLEQANSAFLSHLLKYGELQPEQDNEDAPNRHESSIRFSKDPSFLRLDAESTVSSSTQFGKGSLLQQMSGTSTPLTGPRFRGRSQEQSPARSRAPSDVGSATLLGAEEPEITHEIWFRAPGHITAPQIQRRYHIATRNFLAMLYGRPLVGSDLYEMLSDLQNVMQTFYELNEIEDRRDSTQDIIYYLTERKMDDVRNNLRGALQLLAWCELQSVRWEEGYTETFVHVVGMMTAATMDTPEFKGLSRVSRHNLEYAYNSLQLRIIEAEERLGSFNFNEMWSAEEVTPNHPAMRAFDAFRTFVLNFYTRQYRGWPPQKDHTDRWLSRTIARRLQSDFGVMYDYFVDREVTWDVSETRASRKWQILPMRPREGFSADSPGLPLTDMLVAFDFKHKYQHIPHPYPLLPQASSPAKTAAPTKKGLLGGLKKAKSAAQRDPKEHFQTSLAFNGATNINRFGFPTEGEYTQTDLTDIRHAASLHPIQPGAQLLLAGALALDRSQNHAAGVRAADAVRVGRECRHPGRAGQP